MPVPDKNSEAAKNISQQIFADVEGVMHIVDVSPSVQPEIGSYCGDDPVNNAIDVVAAMTTDLKNQVKSIMNSKKEDLESTINTYVEKAGEKTENVIEVLEKKLAELKKEAQELKSQTK